MSSQTPTFNDYAPVTAATEVPLLVVPCGCGSADCGCGDSCCCHRRHLSRRRHPIHSANKSKSNKSEKRAGKDLMMEEIITIPTEDNEGDDDNADEGDSMLISLTQIHSTANNINNNNNNTNTSGGNKERDGKDLDSGSDVEDRRVSSSCRCHCCSEILTEGTDDDDDDDEQFNSDSHRCGHRLGPIPNERTPASTEYYSFYITGMSCPNCAKHIKEKLVRRFHHPSVAVDFDTQKISFEHPQGGEALLKAMIAYVRDDLQYTIVEEDPRSREGSRYGALDSHATTTAPTDKASAATREFKLEYLVEGMTCTSCAAHVTSVIEKLFDSRSESGTFWFLRASVSFTTSRADVVLLVPEGVSKKSRGASLALVDDEVVEVIGRLGYTATSLNKKKLALQESQTKTNEADGGDGEGSVVISDPQGDAEAAGSERQKIKDTLEHKAEITYFYKNFIGSLFLSSPLMVYMVLMIIFPATFMEVHISAPTDGSYSNLILRSPKFWMLSLLNLGQMVLSVLVIGLYGRRFFTTAFRNYYYHRFFSMDTLISLGTGTAVLYSSAYFICFFFYEAVVHNSTLQHSHNDGALSGAAAAAVGPAVMIMFPELYFDTAGMLITFMLLGKYLESRAIKKTKSAISSLLSLSPDTARRVRLHNLQSCNANMNNDTITNKNSNTISEKENGDKEEEDELLHFNMLVDLFSKPPVTSADNNNNNQCSEVYYTLEEAVPTSEIAVHDVLLILAGETVPLDGTIIKGTSEVDEHLVTGESLPLLKGPKYHNNGSDKYNVIGGTTNLSGTLYVRVDKVGEDLFLNKILSIIQAAQGKGDTDKSDNGKSKSQLIADRLAHFFVPIIILISLITFAVWLGVGFFQYAHFARTNNNNVPVAYQTVAGVFHNALHYFIATIISACPCALAIATPTVVMVAAGLAAREGIIIKESGVLETLGGRSNNKGKKDIRMVFDKTGTLTKGMLKVMWSSFLCVGNDNSDNDNHNDNHAKSNRAFHSSVRCFIEKNCSTATALAADNDIEDNDHTMNNHHDDTAGIPTRVLLPLVYAIEKESTHPIAKAVCAQLLQTLQKKSTKTTHQDHDAYNDFKILEVMSHAGYGVEALVEHCGNQHKVLVGSTSLLLSQDCYTSPGVALSAEKKREKALLQFLKSQPIYFTLVCVSVNDVWSGVFALSDEIKEESAEVLSNVFDFLSSNNNNINKSNNSPFFMVTGDQEGVAMKVASVLNSSSAQGLELFPPSNVRAGALPEEKAAIIRQLQSGNENFYRNGNNSSPSPFADNDNSDGVMVVDNTANGSNNDEHLVVFIGDGMNDAAALMQSDVGISVYSSTEVAQASASVLFLHNHLKLLYLLLHLSRRASQHIRFNLVWALGYNLAMLPFACGIFVPILGVSLPPLFSGLAMAFSSVSVLLCSLALQYTFNIHNKYKREE